jgi:protein arginine kinase activator
MLCDFCKEREAVIFLEQMSGNGQKRKINMCAECAIDRGISSDPRSIEASIGDLFKELANISRKMQRESRRMCPVCGISVGEIRKKGMVGCPECYAIFKDDIRKYIMGKGIKGVYTGSMPERLSNMRSVLNDRIVLQDKLSKAIENEEYEKAAMYRDYLRALEKVPVADGNDGGLNEDEGDAAQDMEERS